MTAGDLVEIYRMPGAPRAEMIRSLLEAHGIPCVLFGGAGGAYPVNVGALAEVRLMVHEADVDRAVELMEAAMRGDLRFDE